MQGGAGGLELGNMGQMMMDEYGNPFIVLEEQGRKKRAHGLEAHKQNIIAARAVAETVRTSLGPRGMDKMIVGPDGDVTVTNDGATILEKMDVENQVLKLSYSLTNRYCSCRESVLVCSLDLDVVMRRTAFS